jgi:segregation and condensation protein A
LFSLTYKIKLPQFEGPFDLLLFFIERDELDIYDIPISKITEDFLSYIQQLNEMKLEVASDFILVAATLMKIKARMLIPRKELDEFGEEIDPRQELVDRLLEYKRYKEVINEFKHMEALRQKITTRGNVLEEIKMIAGKYATETELNKLSLYRLMKVFEKVTQRMEEAEEVKHRVIKYPFTVEEERDTILKVIEKKEQKFEKIFESCKNRIQAIFRFLALLEMIQLNRVSVKIGEGVNNFWIRKSGLVS